MVLYQSSGRSSPWKKFAEQHLRRRSKSADNLQPATPDLRATELPNFTTACNSKAWRLSSEATPTLNLPLSEPKHTISEDMAQEEAHDAIKLNESRLFPNNVPFASPPTTDRSTDSTYRSRSEALPDVEHRTLSVIPGLARHASINDHPRNLPDSESVSVHLHNMRISQHLRSDSTLSGDSGTPTTETQQRPRDSVASGGEQSLALPLHTQPSDSTVRATRRLRCSSSGFTSGRVPEGWGNVVSGTTSSVYEPSSVYSTRQNSLTSSNSCTPVALSGLNIPTSYFPATGHGTIVRKSGYEVLNLGDMGILGMGDVEAPDEKPKASAREDSVVEASTMPGTFPPSSSMNLLKRTDTGLTFRTANEKLEAVENSREATKEKGKRNPFEFVDSSDQTTDAGEDAALQPNQQSPEETTDSSLDITPVTAAESPSSSASIEKTPRAQIVTPAPAAEPSSAKHKKTTSSVKTPSKRFSTFSFFRSKTYSNLRRASHSPALHLRKRSRSEEHLALRDAREKQPKGARGFESQTDGPADPHASSESLEDPPAREQKQSTVSEAVEEHRPGRLSRSWLIGDGRNGIGQGAVWEKALKKHREEKSAMFLSPEKGGKAEARGLFRERSGSASALSALSARSQQSDRKGKAPAIAEDFTFGGARPGLQRTATMVLDPLETTGFGEELMRQRMSSGMLGDELRWSAASGSLAPSAGISPGTSVKGEEPSVVSIEKDQHLDTWGGTTLAEVDLGDLGAWGRFPSHTREQRTGAAGEADNVLTRDFAYESTGTAGTENESSTEDEDTSKSAARRLTTLRSKKRSKTRSGMSKSKSMTFSRNFSFFKHYIGLFRSQSEEFRRHGHGHRSSIAESATLEHPELEILPPVFSPILLESRENSGGLQTDGSASKVDLTDDPEATGVENKAKESRVEFQVQPMNRREESKTDNSDGSWTANARLFTGAYGDDLGRSRKKVDSSAEWWSNARTWTRFNTPSQDFQDVMDDARQKFLMTPTRLGRQVEDVTEEGTTTPAVKRPPRAAHRSSEEWRSDARLYSQLYESCVQVPNFGGSSEDANASESAKRPLLANKHRKSSSAATAFRLASTGHLDAERGNGEKVRFRTLSGGHGENEGKNGEYLARNDSFLSIGSAEGTTMDLMRYLQDLEEGEKAKLEAERGGD
ncbi:hypothetical protein SLS54_005470 [Diplodia seriata]